MSQSVKRYLVSFVSYPRQVQGVLRRELGVYRQQPLCHFPTVFSPARLHPTLHGDGFGVSEARVSSVYDPARGNEFLLQFDRADFLSG